MNRFLTLYHTKIKYMNSQPLLSQTWQHLVNLGAIQGFDILRIKLHKETVVETTIQDVFKVRNTEVWLFDAKGVKIQLIWHTITLNDYQ